MAEPAPTVSHETASENPIYIREPAGVAAFLAQVAGKLGHKPLWYRGQANADWGLLPLVFRSESDDVEAIRSHETRLFTGFYEMARGLSKDCPTGDALYEWLPFARHHGLPTRLLDWTKAALVV